jgi:hypothetical protein
VGEFSTTYKSQLCDSIIFIEIIRCLPTVPRTVVAQASPPFNIIFEDIVGTWIGKFIVGLSSQVAKVTPIACNFVAAVPC